MYFYFTNKKNISFILCDAKMYFGSTLAKQLLMRAPTFDIGTIPKNIDGIEHRLFFYKSCLDSERVDAFF